MGGTGMSEKKGIRAGVLIALLATTLVLIISATATGIFARGAAGTKQDTSSVGADTATSSKAAFVPMDTPTPCGTGSIYFEAEPDDTITTAMHIDDSTAAEIRGGIQTIGD